MEFVQELGRVNRVGLAERGKHGYYTFLNMGTYFVLWLRAQSETEPAVRARKHAQLHQVLNFLVLPHCCYHEYIEDVFENPQTHQSRGPCLDNC